MNIRMAIRARTTDKPFITRQKWADEMCGYKFPPKIMPTNTPDCCLISAYSTKQPCRGWQPSADDLTALDWVTTD